MADCSEALRAAVQANPEAFGPDETGDAPAVMVGAVLLAEWTDIRGESWFTWVSAGPTGDALPGWRIRGLLAECVSGLDLLSRRHDSDG